MTHLSRIKLSSKTEKELKSALKETYLKLNPRDYERLSSALITKTEELMIAKRLGATLMLSEGYTYADISQSLKLTNETISRINFEMKASPENHNYLLKKLKPWMRKKLLKEVLTEIGLQAAKVAIKHAGGRIR